MYIRIAVWRERGAQIVYKDSISHIVSVYSSGTYDTEFIEEKPGDLHKARLHRSHIDLLRLQTIGDSDHFQNTNSNIQIKPHSQNSPTAWTADPPPFYI